MEEMKKQLFNLWCDNMTSKVERLIDIMYAGSNDIKMFSNIMLLNNYKLWCVIL